jgi:hypothetical protein
MKINISGVAFRSARELDRKSGLLGWTSFLVNGVLRLDSIAVRRTRHGALTLSFPSRRDHEGVDHSLVCPISADAHRAIESDVIGALRGEGHVS